MEEMEVEKEEEMEETGRMLVSVQWPRNKTEDQHLAVLHQSLLLSPSFWGPGRGEDWTEQHTAED